MDQKTSFFFLILLVGLSFLSAQGKPSSVQPEKTAFGPYYPLIVGVVVFEDFGSLGSSAKVITLGEKKGSVRPRGGPAVNVDYTFSEAPTLDLLVIPGGGGTRTLVKDQDFLSSLKKLAG